MHPSVSDHLSDAEKGTLQHLPSSSSSNFLKEASKNSTEVIVQPVSPLETPPIGKELTVAAPPAKAPPKKAPHKVSGWIRFRIWYNTYRKFFTFVMALNIVGIVLAATNTWTYPRHYTGAFVLGNLQAAILVRNELFGRLLYLIVNTLFAKWTPLRFRLLLTSVLQHLGGIHSACAVSGFMWLIFKVILIATDMNNNHVAVFVMGIVTMCAILVSILSAFPWVRNTHHNVFEKHHRFVGWLGLVFTWVFVILGDSWDFNTHSFKPDGDHIVRQQDFWFILGMSVFVIIPWLTVRKVKVDVEIPSPKAVILRFERGMQQGMLARISRSSVMEYHAFGIISEGVQSDKHYLICGVQGDFTKGLVENPPTHIWTRELKFAGVGNTTKLYKRGIRVCTGTGLGAALATCLQSPDWYLIWIGSDQEKTFGPTIAGLIHNNLEGRVTLWDSKKRGGRPDTMQLIKDVYKSWNAEVVFITSNWIGNKEMMEGCKEAGIPAFGTLWDF
ncbi:hypothetical protein K435DRAFT_685032 [Dendrothele bispora CBS 962.96]|uniref:Non-ribosomal peptide synthetase n=1 Tax=Dendrothele bispora (strain CBS 962.96) TaxID=1314807 RepID=A0A4S8LAA2_DENBC|nr:hypothetical protein K435DRAFT_685032 [Dendrothele bispora CBS 962.96]